MADVRQDLRQRKIAHADDFDCCYSPIFSGDLV